MKHSIGKCGVVFTSLRAQAMADYEEINERIDKIIGTSAGALFGVNYFSKQKSLVYNWCGFSSFDFGNDFPWPSFF